MQCQFYHQINFGVKHLRYVGKQLRCGLSISLVTGWGSGRGA